MKTFLTLSLLVLLNSQNVVTEDDLSLEVQVVGIQRGKGVIRVCLFDSEEKFFNNASVCEVKEAPQNNQRITVKFINSLQPGKYAVVVYQDLNNNGTLDRNWLGIPAEPYGFSNNPSTFFGPPSFQKAAFEITEHSLITIEL